MKPETKTKKEADEETPVFRKELISWLKTIIFAVAFAFFITNVIIVNAKVPTPSMQDTIPSPCRVVAYRLSYLFKKPERYDVVVFKYPDDKTRLFVKRVIGLPEEKVEIKNGKVYINDSKIPLDDGFVKDLKNVTLSYGPYYVPKDCYFMLGDNRNNSEDSRMWTEKFVIKQDILGKVLFCYYPELKLIK